MSKKQLKILLVDDDEGCFTATRDLLSEIEGHEFEVDWAPSVDTASDVISKKRHDIYFIDYNMGNGAGLGLLCDCTGKGYNVPCIMLISQDSHKIEPESIHLAASDYLVKDEMNSSLLARSIRNALKQKQVILELRQAKEYADNIIRSSMDMIIAFDMDFKVIEFNKSAERIFGYTKSEVLYRPSEILFSSKSQNESVFKEILGQKGCSCETVFMKKDHTTFSVYLTGSILSGANGDIIGIMTISRANGDQKSLEKMTYDAMHDSLTKLPNRDLFINRVKFALERKKRKRDYNFAVLFLDIDRFNLVNDSMGHKIGDELLVSISKRLKDCIRSCDTIARIGGDEFGILLEDVENIEMVKLIACRLLKSMNTPFTLNNQIVFSSVSIGIALSSNEYVHADDILRDADTVMYRAKSMGKARYAIFDVEMHSKVVEILKLEADLRKAVEEKEFIAYYQPIVSLKDGRIYGVEALVRWQHPCRGLLSPFHFISLAEETGLIVSIGEQMIEQACKQYIIWKDSGFPDINVIVNFSSIQFKSPNIINNFKKILNNTGMNPKRFGIEITESTIMEQTDFSMSALKEIYEMGISISIDDFGTGYSALSSLRMFTIHKIKIDRSLIKDVTVDPNAATITKTIINMAHGLNLSVVAEGVETQDQLEFLKKYNSDYMQGYLFSKPVPPAEITAMLKEGKRI